MTTNQNEYQAMTPLARIKGLADKAGLRSTTPHVALLAKAGSASELGLVVRGMASNGERGDEYQYLVFDEAGLLAIGTEQGNYAGGLDWRRSSKQQLPKLSADLQSLLLAFQTASQQG